MKAPALQLRTHLAAIALTIASFPVLTLAQVPAAAIIPGTAPTYAEEPVVIEHADSIFNMLADGTGWRQLTLTARLQSDAALKKYGVLSVAYASSSEHVEIKYTRVRHPDGTVSETQASDAMDMPSAVTRAAPFYSDQKELQLPIRSLRVGDTLEFQYRIVSTKAEAPGQFWGRELFTEATVVLSQTVELRVPTGMYVNVWSPNLKPVESNNDATTGTPAQHVYRWTYSQLKPTAGKDAEAAAAANKKILWTADQELDLEQGRLPTIAWTTFKSWEDVGAWYRSLETDRIVPDDTIKAKVAELTAGKSTDEAKAQALYTYVATNIRYIGVAFGIGRYQPHTAAEILSNQYGDCKDKHTLLAAMLSAVGIQSDAVLIGAGIRFNQAVPSPAAFNHLITHLTLGGKPVWLDATAEVAPFGMLTSRIRDKQSLVIPNTAPIAIVRTPLEPLNPNAITFDAVGSLDAAGVSTSHIVLTTHGDNEIAMRAAFRQLQPAQYDQVVQTFSKVIGFTGTTTNPEITKPTDTTQPFKLSFDYKREKAGDWDHLKTIPQVMIVVLPRVTDIDPPVHAIQLGIPRTDDSTSSMKLPEGWAAILPHEVHAKCAYGTYDMTYRLEGNTLYAERRLVILQKNVPVSDWKTYKDWVDKVKPGMEPYIQLINHSNNPGGASGSSASVSPGTPKAPEEKTKQIEDALNSHDPNFKNIVAYSLATQNNHLSDAETLAEQAVEIQEKTASELVSMDNKVKSFDLMQILGADWETLGWVYYRQGQHSKAENYMHAAWELKPRNVDINLYLGLIYEAQHKRDDAASFYRMALSASNAPNLQALVHTRLDRLGVTTTDPLPTDVATPLPSLNLQPGPTDTELIVDILLSRDQPPAVNLIRGNLALEKPLTEAIRSALANPFPDTGPEKLLRRARITCAPGDKPACTLHFLGSQLAMEASSNANQAR
jgi:tetratricopeptide (TPR) repeat protein